MKALSIKQPWAHLIASGTKDIENRTWKPKTTGKILIHASAKIVDVDFSTGQTADLYTNNIWLSGTGFPKEMRVVSAIIGEVEIVDFVQNHDSVWAEKPPSGDKPIWNWVLANAILYERPILNVKGKLSLWEAEFGVCPKCKSTNILTYEPGHSQCRECKCEFGI